MISSKHVTRGLFCGALIGALGACMRPPADPPGVEQQPIQHPERNIASQHTVSPEPGAIPAADSPDDPDSPGTTRTPPAAPALPMDQAQDPSLASALADAGVR